MTADMKLDDFDFHLPEALIAQMPCEVRSLSRLLEVNHSELFQHRQFKDIEQLLNPGDLLVVNNAKVIKARLFGEKQSGGKIELLVERVVSTSVLITQIKASKAPKAGSIIILKSLNEDQTFSFEIIEKQAGFYQIELVNSNTDTNESAMSVLEVVDRIGKIPLPPYIERQQNQSGEEAQTSFDEARYQTVYAKEPGAVAAPTAGLHFDDELLARLKAKGVTIAETTLYVGAGTFQPVRVDNIHQHKMHTEFYSVSQSLVDSVKKTKSSGNRVVAVGTTSLRALESAAVESAANGDGTLQPFDGETSIFIFPGFEFKCVDALITNFHLPKSTLMMLVSAFVGREKILSAYEEAIKEQYRFFSYGDAMFLHRQ